MDDKFRKSLVKYFQNEQKLTKFLTYVPLIEIINGKISIDEKGLKIIQSQLSGNVYLVSMYCKNHKIINNIYHNNKQPNSNRSRSGIWITNYPRFDQEHNSHFLYLQTFSLNHEDAIKLHMICSLICSTIIIDVNQYQRLNVLTSINGRIIYDKKEENSNKNVTDRKRQIGNIAILTYAESQESNFTMKRPLEEVKALLKKNNIEDKVHQLYEEIVLLKVSENKLTGNNTYYSTQVQNNIKMICFKCKKNEDLHEGPILIGFLHQIVDSINLKNIVEITQSMKKIEICVGYDAYTRSVQFYNKEIKKQIHEEGVPNINPLLKHLRQDAIEQFHKHSQDSFYLSNLNDYIGLKQQKIKEENNKVHDLKNIQYLQKSSDELFTKIQTQKIPKDKMAKHLQTITDEYTQKAHGDNKYELLSNYMNTLHSTLNKDSNNNNGDAQRKTKKQLQAALQEKRINQEKVENLQKQIKQLQQQAQRQQNEKCCAIM